MGKWNKAAPQISQQFRQNEQRRKQMILQAAKRRKQKQKKLQEQVQMVKKNQQQALTKHKQQKQDAYIKYLRNNMHDKYEQMKYNQKINQPEIRTKSKWKKQKQNNNQTNDNQLQGLNLEVNIDKYHHQNNNNNNKYSHNNHAKPIEANNHQRNSSNNQLKMSDNFQNNEKKLKSNANYKRRMLEDEFQKQWNDQNQNDNHLSPSQYLEDDLIGSKLLDSLDLDFQTVSRGKEYNKKLKQSYLEFSRQKDVQEKQVNQIKNMIGYESVLMSIDQRSEIIKKYNQLMVNEVQNPHENPFNMKKNKNDDRNKDKLKIIENDNKNTKKKSVEKTLNQNNKAEKPANQREFFNELKNNKQGKILNWANEEAQEAEDLFSNCSTNKRTTRSKGAQLLKQINRQIQQKKSTSQTQIPQTMQANVKKKEGPLETIFQKNLNRSKQKIRERSYEKKNTIINNNEISKTQSTSFNKQSNEKKNNISQQKQHKNIPIPRPNRMNSAENNNLQGQPPQPMRKIVLRENSKQKVNKTTTNGFKQNSNLIPQQRKTQEQYRNKSNSHRSLSKEKQNHKEAKQIIIPNNNCRENDSSNVNGQNQHFSRQILTIDKPKSKLTSQSSLSGIPIIAKQPQKSHTNNQFYNRNQDQITIATQDQVFQIESFIKNQLLSLNREQRQVQEQLKNIHLNNRQKLKQMQQKYQIKLDYKHSKQLMEGYLPNQEENNNNLGYKRGRLKQTEDELEESIQRLDDMLLRREIIQIVKHPVIPEQDNQSQSTSRSIINPMSDPIQLHKQVLQLAENLSRFQGEPEDISAGYGGKLRLIKKNRQKTVEKVEKIQKKQAKYSDVGLSESQDVNYSQINSNTNTKKSKASKVSRPPQLEYVQNNYIRPEFNTSDLLDDQLDDSIEKGKIQVNQRLKKMLLE